MQQNQDITLLQKVYHNASMGERAARLMLEKSGGSGMSAKLSELAGQYASVRQEAAQELSTFGEIPAQPGPAESAVQWMGVQLGALVDKSPSHMAQMLIMGSTRNMVDSIGDIKQNHGANTRARQLAGRLVRVETDSLAAMKTYLS